MIHAGCHPERQHKARGLCSSCYDTAREHRTIPVRCQTSRYLHNHQTRLEAAIARWGTPHKAAEQTDYPFRELWQAWLRLEAAIAPVPRRGRPRKDTT